ncbi:MAG: DUF6065 family protein [Hyphomicrobiales bacterium]
MKIKCYRLSDDAPAIRPGQPARVWMDEVSGRHPYRCLPLTMANTSGWEILSPYRFTASWTGGPRQDDLKLVQLCDRPYFSHFAASHFAYGILTFNLSWIFNTEPGWAIWASGAPNSIKDGIAPLAGLVETDWLPYPFTMNWKMTRPGSVTFEAGEPVCFVMPVPLKAVDEVELVEYRLEDDPELKARHDSFRDTRRTWEERKAAGDPAVANEAWQRFYFKGDLPDGSHAPGFHINKRRLAGLRRADGSASTFAASEPVMKEMPATTGAAENRPAPVFGCPVHGFAAPQDAPKAPAVPKGKVHPVDRPDDIVNRNDMRWFAGSDPSVDVHYEENFLPFDECVALMNTFQANQQAITRIARERVDSIWDNRVIYPERLPPEYRFAKRIVQDARARILQRIHAFFKRREPLYNDTTHIVRWAPGMNMSVHADNCNDDGSANIAPYREFGSIVYLNDDYEGGEFVAPSLGIKVRPKTGLLLCFRGGPEHAHGVTTVRASTRYTMAGWYTGDAAHWDESWFELY